MLYLLHDETICPRPTYTFRPFTASAGFLDTRFWTLNPRAITALEYNPTTSLLCVEHGRGGAMGMVWVQFMDRVALERFLWAWVGA